MSDYPPRLVGVKETAFGSILVLSDGHDLPIDVAPDRLNDALLRVDQPSLSEVVAARSLKVYFATWDIAAEDWTRIGEVVLASHTAVATFGQIPTIWDVLLQPAALVRDLPQRVYGGLQSALYTLHPFNFRPDPNRPAPWLRALLSASGSRLFNTWVNPQTGDVDIESDVLVGHFVE